MPSFPSFTNPAAFLLFLLIPLLFIFRKFKIFNRISFEAVLEDWEGRRFEWKGRSQKILTIFAKILLGVGYTLSVVAFADPVISYREKVYTTQGTDIVFVVDTSPSMAAKDMNGITRLESAKEAIFNLSKNNEGCMFGLVTLGSNASVLVPPTSDSTAFTSRLAEIQVGILGNGSAIGDGLSTAICHLVSSSAPKKCIILLTDGENNAGEIHPETAAKLAAENNITIYVLGVGTKGNVPLEYTDPLNGKQYSGYLDSNFNSASLKKIAHIGNGRYFEVQTINELVATLSTVTKMENVSQKFTYKTVNNNYYQKFVFVAIIICILAWIIKRVILREMICFKYKKILYLRSAILSFGFIMLLLAYSGISWGSYLVPVQKSGNSVAMVFDISNSMLANDGPENSTRLKAASVYAKKLLTKMDGVSTSVVLAKGDGVAAIPLTQDKSSVETLLDVLSPSLSTSPGTSLAKGLLKAKETFSTNFSNAGRIWLFTDGEETDGQLENAFLECLKSGIPVTVIGFGSEKEIGVLSGDKTTIVKSALRSDNINKAIEHATNRFNFYGNQAKLSYINSASKGSALFLLNEINGPQSETLLTTYEAKPIPRYKFFLALSIMTFIFSYVIIEFKFGLKKATFTSVLILFTILNLSSCSSDTQNILNGTISYHQKKYRHAVSQFKNTAEKALENYDEQTLNYALYNLGTAYLMLGEETAALEIFTSILPTAPNNVLYSAYYNSGILCHKNGNYEEAKNYFKKALEIDSTSLEAKMNFELSVQTSSQNAIQNESNTIQASTEDSDINDIENAVFERIKENDKNQWKNSETSQNINLADDY